MPSEVLEGSWVLIGAMLTSIAVSPQNIDIAVVRCKFS
jgi:hypothetical protein